MEKSRESTDIANVRSAYAEVVTAYLTGEDTSKVTVEAQQTVKDWQGPSGTIEYFSDNQTHSYSYSAVLKGKNYAVEVDVDESTGNATPKITEE